VQGWLLYSPGLGTSGNITAALQQLYLIWSHQIQIGKEKLVFGRGSPEMKFMSEEANEEEKKKFHGALPTTIYQAGFSEIYGQNPDIDSTALMISTTANENPSDYVSGLLFKLGITDPKRAIDYLVPKILTAVDYLAGRDIDEDGLLEQSHNEDWMDTVLRAGKIAYSQACWILALKDLSTLLQTIDREKESDRVERMSDRAIRSVDHKLWSNEDGSYIDIQVTYHIGGPYRTLTQDISLYLLAMSEYGGRRKTTHNKQGVSKSEIGEHKLYRAQTTLDALKSRIWKENWPLVTEVALRSTGPWMLKPYQYHNLTFWPWTAGIELLARSRFDRVEECNLLLSTLTTESNLHMHTFYEWINPITAEGNGAFPFRTGISAVRISVFEILSNIMKGTSSDN
jgi:hypothetical protein